MDWKTEWRERKKDIKKRNDILRERKANKARKLAEKVAMNNLLKNGPQYLKRRTTEES